MGELLEGAIVTAVIGNSYEIVEHVTITLRESGKTSERYWGSQDPHDWFAVLTQNGQEVFRHSGPWCVSSCHNVFMQSHRQAGGACKITRKEAFA